MRTLLIVAGLFFSLCAAFIIYFAASDSGHEYDLNLVLPIDTRQMPKAVAPPPVISHEADTSFTSAVPSGRAEAGPLTRIPERPPVQFGERPGAASEGRGGE
ncbi:MAG TPA: hypothetical protein VE986_07610 [Hyphomicrobiales bacterium]|nr:hypothetical protein [Hyphomicrobiales bacterium]